jgi:hypothetical protein
VQRGNLIGPNPIFKEAERFCYNRFDCPGVKRMFLAHIAERVVLKMPTVYLQVGGRNLGTITEVKALDIIYNHYIRKPTPPVIEEQKEPMMVKKNRRVKWEIVLLFFLILPLIAGFTYVLGKNVLFVVVGALVAFVRPKRGRKFVVTDSWEIGGGRKECGCTSTRTCDKHSIARKCRICGFFQYGNACFCHLKRYKEIVAGVLLGGLSLYYASWHLATPRLCTVAACPVKVCPPMRPSVNYRPPTSEIGREQDLRGLFLNGVGVYGATPIRVANTTHSLTQALVGRALADTPPVNARVAARFKKFVKKHYCDIFPNFGTVERISDDEWLSYFKQGQRNVLRRAIKEAELDGGWKKKTNFYVNAHTKIEKLNKWNDFVEVGPVANDKFITVSSCYNFLPRAIQAFSPVANWCLGPFVRAYQRRVKRVWNENFFIRFGSGCDSEAMGRLFQRKGVDMNTRCIEDDFTQYDSTQGRCMFTIFSHLLKKAGIDRDVRASYAYHNLFKTRGSTRAGHKYSVPFTVKSGASTTTVQNSVINAVAHLWAISETTKWTLVEIMERVVIIVNGDDNVIIDISGLLDEIAIAARLRSLGLVPKIKATTLGAVTFCASRLLQTDTGLIAVPTLGRLLPKVCWSLMPQDDPYKWVQDVLAGMRHVAKVTPFLDVLYDHFGRPCDGSADPHVQWTSVHDFTVTANERRRFLSVYGLNEIDVDDYRRVLKHVGTVGLVSTYGLAVMADLDN